MILSEVTCLRGQLKKKADSVADFLGALLWPPLPCPLASRMDNSEETRLVLYLFISHKHVKKSVSTGFSCVVALAV